VIFLVMNYLIVPLSAWHAFPKFSPYKFVANLCAMLLFGLIVSRCARNAFASAASFDRFPASRNIRGVVI
jgi:hypothetical protein